MKTIFSAVIPLIFISCTTQGVLGFGLSVVEERKNPDGSYKLVVEGAPNTGGNIIEFFVQRVNKLCDNKSHELKKITDKGFVHGNPIFGAVIVCKK